MTITVGELVSFGPQAGKRNKSAMNEAVLKDGPSPVSHSKLKNSTEIPISFPPESPGHYTIQWG